MLLNQPRPTFHWNSSLFRLLQPLHVYDPYISLLASHRILRSWQEYYLKPWKPTRFFSHNLQINRSCARYWSWIFNLYRRLQKFLRKLIYPHNWNYSEVRNNWTGLSGCQILDGHWMRKVTHELRSRMNPMPYCAGGRALYLSVQEG